MRHQMPAQVRGAGLSLFAIAQQEEGCAAFNCPEAKSPAGGKIEGFGFPPDIGNDSRNGAAGQGFLSHPKEVAHAFRPDDDELIGMKA